MCELCGSLAIQPGTKAAWPEETSTPPQPSRDEAALSSEYGDGQDDYSLASQSNPDDGSLDAVYGGSIAATGNVLLDGLIYGHKWDNSQPITYFFDNSGSSAWSDQEKQAFRDALASWSNVANITFLEVDNATAANFIEVKYSSPPPSPGAGVVLGRHELPNGTNKARGEFNQAGYGWDSAGLQQGGLGFSTIVHELGHALGLDHPHPESGAAAAFPGVNAQGDLGDNSLNQSIYTVMSYNHGYISGLGALTAENYGDIAGPGAIDIAAIQHLYGANTSYANGNDTYVLPTANAAGTAWRSIWDTGGTDTIVHNGSAAATINLMAATITNAPGGGGFVSSVAGIHGGFTIARNAVIENATGGSGADVLIGNAAANTLTGNDGVDNIFGAGGNDTLLGGNAADVLYGDSSGSGSSGVGSGSGSFTPTGTITNTSLATAMSITSMFATSANANISNSTTVPHFTWTASTSTTGTASPWLAVTVAARSTLSLDIDAATGSLDTIVRLFDAGGNLLLESDDNAGDPGSTSIRDSALSYTVLTGGTYYIQVDDYYSNGTGVLPAGVSYDLHVSVTDPAPIGSDGAAGNDSISGGAGNDTIDGGAGTDALAGGADDDTYYVDTYLDVIVELANEGTDTVFSADHYIFHANVENATVTGTGDFGILGNEIANVMNGNSGANGMAGGLGNDTMNGGAGNDALDGQQGNDSMSGGTGSDVYFVDSSGDIVVEVSEADVYDIVWTMVDMTLPQYVEILILNGGTLAINSTGNDGPADNTPNLMLGNNAANTITTYGGNDIVMGLDGNDVISTGGGGGGGYDLLIGGRGSDTMTGGAGHDYFAYGNVDEAGDTITDFTTTGGSNLDILDLRLMFGTFTGTGGITTVAQAVASGHLTFTQAGAHTQVFVDTDGGANGNVLLATLQNTTSSLVQGLTLI